MTDERTAFDVVIIGAGVAGAATAVALEARGLDCLLVDRAPRCPPCFKAEKIEPDQADLLRELDLMEGLRRHLTPIPSVATAYRGSVLERVEIEQYGVDYPRLANAIREELVPSPQLTARATAIEAGAHESRVRLADGRVLTARLVVLAAGTSPSLAHSIGLARSTVRENQCLAVAFDVDAGGGCPGTFALGRDFASITYYAENVRSRYAYLTLFPIEDRMRANLFVCLEPRAKAARALLADPAVELRRQLARLERLTGPLETAGRVDAQLVDLYTTDGQARDGVVVIGDAFQSVDPATGTGLSKVLTDVVVLASHVPDWLSTPGMSAEKTRAFLEDERKRSADARSLEMAEYRYAHATDGSLRWHVHRARHYGSVAWRRGLTRRLGLVRKVG